MQVGDPGSPDLHRSLPARQTGNEDQVDVVAAIKLRSRSFPARRPMVCRRLQRPQRYAPAGLLVK